VGALGLYAFRHGAARDTTGSGGTDDLDNDDAANG